MKYEKRKEKEEERSIFSSPTDTKETANKHRNTEKSKLLPLGVRNKEQDLYTKKKRKRKRLNVNEFEKQLHAAADDEKMNVVICLLT